MAELYAPTPDWLVRPVEVVPRSDGEPIIRPDRHRGTSLSPPERFLLEQWATVVKRAFVEAPYLVGSVARGEPWRDVDVRLILSPRKYSNLAGEHFERIQVLNVALSLWGQRATGLPIDFQFQDIHEAGQHCGPRCPLGLEI